MAIPTRETSGLVVKIDHRGRMKLFVNGHRVVGMTRLDTSSEHGIGGTMTFTIMTRFVNFEHDDAIAPEGVDAN